MVSSIYSDKKGIYRDLYRTLDSDNKKKKPVKKQRKGIYIDLYKQIENDIKIISFKDSKENEQKSVHLTLIIMLKKAIHNFLSKLSFFFSIVASEFKPILFASVVAKKPINNYIENNLPDYQNQGIYYNEG